MGVEIERRYWVTHSPTEAKSLFEELLSHAEDVLYIEQVYMDNTGDWVMRARATLHKGGFVHPRYCMTFKKRKSERQCTEIEPDIDRDAYKEIREEVSRGLLKTRIEVSTDDGFWFVDFFHGKLSGLVLAEIELDTEEQTFTVPKWCLREVTGEPWKWSNQMLAHEDWAHEAPDCFDPIFEAIGAQSSAL